ncbi:hypothetical protein BAE44_0003957 [Dichanthelium oligosanthes]|uniref:Uncharacterized protein n=1 Tax=Dichanthelium oligosanthes TaxID=888268 RepID=A0A1E5WCA9_9POAL|nr:hypothetical protein BAE44_0003957 [Dichanthelium oligosanthes]
MAIAAAAAAAVLSHDRPRDDPVPPAVRAGWALFEKRVALGHLANTAAAAVSKTTNGRDVRVSLRRLATPPASSCAQLYTDDKLSEEPSIVAADGGLLLIIYSELGFLRFHGIEMLREQWETKKLAMPHDGSSRSSGPPTP